MNIKWWSPFEQLAEQVDLLLFILLVDGVHLFQ